MHSSAHPASLQPWRERERQPQRSRTTSTPKPCSLFYHHYDLEARYGVFRGCFSDDANTCAIGKLTRPTMGSSDWLGAEPIVRRFCRGLKAT